MNKILHISKYYYPFQGGTEQTARDCVNALREEYEQKVICFNVSKENKVDMVDGIEVNRVGTFAKISSQSVAAFYGSKLKKLIESFKPDCIIFHYPNPFVAHFLLKYFPCECKLIVYWHLDIIKQRFLGLFFKSQNKRLISRADKIITTSPLYLEGSKYLSSVREKCVVIPSCINIERLQVTQESRKIADDIKEKNKNKIICFAVGRHTKYKGFKYLIEASKSLDDRFQIYIAGTGEKTKQLIKLARDDEKIRFPGLLCTDELVAYYLAMDIFCFPSITKNEAFGLALAEAMYFGKPAVTFTIPGSGVNYVCLSGKNGIEVPNGNVSKYAEALNMLAEDQKVRTEMGKAGKRRIEELCLPNGFHERIVGIIESLNIDHK